MSDADTVDRLLREMETRDSDHDPRFSIETLDKYYDGESRMTALGLALPPNFDKLRTVVNWPRLTVDSLEERLDVEGFRFGTDTASDRLNEWWITNRLAAKSSIAHTEALVQGESYIAVGVREDDPEIPLITVESRHSMHAKTDPRTGEVTEALRVVDSRNGQPVVVTLYLPDRTVYLDRTSGGQWAVTDTDAHGRGRVPVVPMRNRARLCDRYGRSEMADVVPLTDAACRALTNLQGAQEFLAVPQRYVLGAEESDFVGPDGEKRTAWEAYVGHFLALSNGDAKMGQLSAADLRNFTDTINAYARMVGALSGLPPHFLGFSSDNPASADAIRSSEARLVKRAERRATAFGDAWEEAMRLALLWVDGEIPTEARRLETMWRDPATPTFSAKADAVVKLATARTAEGPLLPRVAAWEELGYSPERIRRLLEMTADDPAVQYLAATSGGVMPDES